MVDTIISPSFDGPWIAFTPTVTAASGTLGTPAPVALGRYQIIGKTCFLMLDITVPAIGTGSGSVNVSGLPFSIRGNMVAFGVDAAQSGFALTASNIDQSSLGISDYQGNFPVSNNSELVINGAFEVE